MQSFDLIDEQRIRDAAELPPVTRRLRQQVLRSAKKAERRRRIHRRIVLAACFLLPLVALTVWFHGATDNSISEFAAEDAGRTRADKVEMPSAIDAWEGVDESLQKRKSDSNAIQGGLY